MSDAAKNPNEIGIEKCPLASAIWRLYNDNDNSIKQDKLYCWWVNHFVIWKSLSSFFFVLFQPSQFCLPILFITFSLILTSLFPFIYDSSPYYLRILSNMKKMILFCKIMYKILPVITFSLLNEISSLCKQLNCTLLIIMIKRHIYIFTYLTQPSHHKDFYVLKGLFAVFCRVFCPSPRGCLLS